jgi:inner membrane protein
LLQVPDRQTLVFAALLLALADWGSQRAGSSVVPGGPLDELAHGLSTMLVVWALGPRIAGRFLVPALIASVAIDADHIPGRLGANFLTAGTPRPYTHSVLTVVVVFALAALCRTTARRRILLGMSLGLVIHFWRDLSESGTGVPLLWPFTDAGASLPHWTYVVAMVAVVVIGWRRNAVRRSPADLRAASRQRPGWHPSAKGEAPG